MIEFLSNEIFFVIVIVCTIAILIWSFLKTRSHKKDIVEKKKELDLLKKKRSEIQSEIETYNTEIKSHKEEIARLRQEEEALSKKLGEWRNKKY